MEVIQRFPPGQVKTIVAVHRRREMTLEEIYRLGVRTGRQFPTAPKGKSIARQVAKAPLPTGVLPNTPQARMFRLGCYDGIRRKVVYIRTPQYQL